MSAATVGLAGCTSPSGGDGASDTAGTTRTPPRTSTRRATATRSPPAAARDTTTTEAPPTTTTQRAASPGITALREMPDDWTVTLQTASGTGDTDVDAFRMPGGLLAAVASYEGDGEFAATLANNTSGYAQTRLFKFDGAAVGSSAVPTESGEYYVDIQTSGAWDIEIIAPRTPEGAATAPPFTVSGTGYATFGVASLSGETTVTASHDGEELLVFAATEDARTYRRSTELFDTDQPIEGQQTTASLDGRYWFVVKTNGAWTIEVT